MSVRAIVLGCGSSAGVPRLGAKGGGENWGACDPAEPRNRRTRCSIILQRADPEFGWEADALTTVLIDTSPDLRAQLLREKIYRIDAVFYTHDHADQTHGIDDLRPITYAQRGRIPAYLSALTAPDLVERFRYCFHHNQETGYPAILEERALAEGDIVMVDGPSGPLAVTPFLGDHGPVKAFGFRGGLPGADGQSIYGGIAYAPDMSGLDNQAFEAMKGAEAVIFDALRYDPHVSHAHLERTLDWVERSGAPSGYLTNLHVDMDYRTVEAETPSNVHPCYDGLEIRVSY